MSSSPLLDQRAPCLLRVAVGGAMELGARAFAAAVQQRGHRMRYCERMPALVQTVLGDEYDVAVAFVADVDQALRLSSWFVGRRPSTQLVIVCGAQQQAEFEAMLPAQTSAMLWTGLALDEQLATLETLQPRVGLVGRYIEIELVDYVQIVAINASSKLIRVQMRGGSGYIWFERGNLVHAELGQRDGEQAFYSMVCAGTGSFCEVRFEPPPTNSVQASNTHLLMEASRLKDEQLISEVNAGPHPLDAKLFEGMHALQSQTGSVELMQDTPVLPEAFDPAIAANDIEILSESSVEFALLEPGEFVDHCNGHAAVIQAVEIPPGADERGFWAEHPADELRRWSRTVWSLMHLRSSSPRSVVCQRETQTHFVGIVFAGSLVTMQVLGNQDPFALRDELIDWVTG